VVKTIGDAVMATFSTPDRALAAALRMREAIGDVYDDFRHACGILQLRRSPSAQV
jgi:class 3 adenylate cyclase